MSNLTEEQLIQIARTYYPLKHSNEVDDKPASQHLSEFHRWEAAWDRAMEWKECDSLIEAIQATFPEHRAGRFVQPRRVACLYCILALETPGPSGDRRITRIVGALSVLAPLYLVYVTRTTLGAERHSARPRLSFTPEDAERPYTDTLAQLIERSLVDYRPFPLELADVPLPDLCIDFLHLEQPTLLTAFFANHLENLP